MAKDVNKVTLLGHLGKDPEVHNADLVACVVTLNLATTNGYKDKTD